MPFDSYNHMRTLFSGSDLWNNFGIPQSFQHVSHWDHICLAVTLFLMWCSHIVPALLLSLSRVYLPLVVDVCDAISSANILICNLLFNYWRDDANLAKRAEHPYEILLSETASICSLFCRMPVESKYALKKTETTSSGDFCISSAPYLPAFLQ